MRFVQATINRRFWAFVLDMIVLYLLDLILVMVISAFTLLVQSEWLLIMVLLVFSLLNIFFLPLCETFFHGQTLGKMCLGIRVVRTDGSPATGINCLQRFVVLPFDTVFTLGMGGLISMMVTDKRQRLGDIAADTMVICNHPQNVSINEIHAMTINEFNEFEHRQFVEVQPYPVVDTTTPMDTAEKYRGMQSSIAMLRTRKAHPKLILMFERILADMHVQMFQKTTTTFADLVKTTIHSVPRAVYESRWCIILAFVIAAIGYLIGVYSQQANPDFFESYFGQRYYLESIENIEKGNPMGIYGSMEQWEMLFRIFLNNFMVAFYMYMYGLIVLIGPIFYLLNNTVMMGVFDTFFAQQGYMIDALVTPNEHGTLEITSIIIVGGAAIRLGTGWLFPGKLSRLRALVRGARQSLLIFLSTVPMLFVAAVIESFVSRHTEWPMSVKLSIIIISSLILIGYYVMLPILAKRD